MVGYSLEFRKQIYERSFPEFRKPIFGRLFPEFRKAISVKPFSLSWKIFFLLIFSARTIVPTVFSFLFFFLLIFKSLLIAFTIISLSTVCCLTLFILELNSCFFKTSKVSFGCRLDEDVYCGLSLPLLPVAAGHPAGGQPAHRQAPEHLPGRQHIIDKHQNICQVDNTSQTSTRTYAR